jgi:hypothetical protein
MYLDLGLSGPSRLIFSVAAASGIPLEQESMSIMVDGADMHPTEVADAHGGRLHSVWADGSQLTLDYSAVASGVADPPLPNDIDQIVYLRPRRYCESDSLGPTAASEFAGISRTCRSLCCAH